MMLNVVRTDANPCGESLGRHARRLRLEIESQMVATEAFDGLALQAIGLLLQLEGIDRVSRSQAQAIEVRPKVAALHRSPA